MPPPQYNIAIARQRFSLIRLHVKSAFAQHDHHLDHFADSILDVSTPDHPGHKPVSINLLIADPLVRATFYMANRFFRTM